MNTFRDVWNSFAKSKKYREAFTFSLFKRMVPFQIRALRKQREWSQEQLAKSANLTQGVVSRAEDPDYGNLTINTIRRIAAGFDVAFIVKFVPFSELDKWFLDLSEVSVQVRSFEEENEALAVALHVHAQDSMGDELVSDLVKATLTREQIEEEKVEVEVNRKNMNNILSPKPTFADKQREAGVTLCR